MKFFSSEKQKKIRGFLERTGILFPKGQRSGTDRRLGDDSKDMSLDDYLATEGTDRQDHFVMRSNSDRREDRAVHNPLDGML